MIETQVRKNRQETIRITESRRQLLVSPLLLLSVLQVGSSLPSVNEVARHLEESHPGVHLGEAGKEAAGSQEAFYQEFDTSGKNLRTCGIWDEFPTFLPNHLHYNRSWQIPLGLDGLHLIIRIGVDSGGFDRSIYQGRIFDYSVVV